MDSMIRQIRNCPSDAKGTLIAMDERTEKFYVDTPFVKSADEKGVLSLRGYASTWLEDRDKEHVAPDAFNDSIGTYLSKNPILLWQHQQDKPIGSVKDLVVDEFGVHAEASVPPPEEREPDWAHLAYNKIRRGIVKTFSIGGTFTKKYHQSKTTISRVDLLELSVVSIPANVDTIFEAAAKALGEGSMRPELSPKMISQMAQIIGLKSITDPELSSMSPEELDERYDDLAEGYRRVGILPPDRDAWNKHADPLFAARGKDALLNAKPVLEVARRVYGYVPEVKRGRTISAKNEDKLKQARELLDDVISQVIDNQEDEDGQVL